MAVLWFCVFPGIIVYFSLTVGAQVGRSVSSDRVDSLCRSRLEKLGEALALYAADHNGYLPPGDRWVDATWKYGAKKDPKNESESVFRCPTISARRTGEFGYALNEAVAGKKLEDLGSEDALVFDSDDLSRNATQDVARVPNPLRHARGKENYAVTAARRVLGL